MVFRGGPVNGEGGAGFEHGKQENEKMGTNRASDISRKKKQNFVGFSGANSQKHRLISWDFRGRKVKIRRKIGQSRGF